MKRILLAIALLGLFIGSARAQTYSLTDLGTLGGTQTYARHAFIEAFNDRFRAECLNAH